MQQQLTAPQALPGTAGGKALAANKVAELARRAGVATRAFLLSDLLSIFLVTRLGYVLLTYFGRALFHDPALVGANHIGFSGYLLDSWFYRDSQWFRAIVVDGYQFFGTGARSSVAFFPVYPAVTKALNTITGVEPGLAAIIVSNLAFLGALVYLQKLCLREYGESVASRAVFYMAIFPTAFFSFAPYSEPLFIMLTVASLYYMRCERWWLAGAFGGIAAGTRILGVLLAIPFAVEYVRVHGFDIRRFRLSVLAGLLIPGGLGAYMLYLYGLTGDALAFVHAARGWGRTSTWPWQVLANSLADVPKSGADHPYFQAHAIFENGLLLACILILLLGVRLIPLSMTLYGLACVAALLSAPVITSDIPITSMSRYLFVVFPIYVVLARIGRWPIFDRLYVMLSIGGLAIFTTLFLNHMWGP